ncbi:MAG TPA: MFS transporter [Solirubrobacteraceae bacterium]|nr:MFS transporter [Solirubrobacteraceae bacterium]
MHGHRARNIANPLLLLLSIAQLMVILDISAVNVALPDLASDLHLADDDLGWTITSYSLVFGSLLLLGGRAADLLGRRRMFLAGLGVFVGSSLAAALAADAALLFAARAGQGLGAAMLSPAALSIITTSFHGAERARALAVWGAVGGAGAAIGVLLGGVLTELVSWRAIFFINLPVGVLVAAGALHVVPADRHRARWTGLDVRGALLATAGLGGLVFALSQAQTAGWASAQTLGAGSAALLVLALFVALELRTATPLLRVQRLADRAVGGGLVMMLTASAVMFGSFLLSSLYLQRVLGTGALATGLAFLPFAAVIGVGVHIAGRLIDRFGVRIPMASGFAVAAGGLLLLSSVGAGGSYVADVLPGMLVVGLGLGTILVSVTVSVLAGAADEESGMLSGLNTTGHEVGGSLGIAVLASVATTAAGIGDAFLVAAAVAAVGSLVALVVLPSARHFLPKLALTPRIAVH